MTALSEADLQRRVLDTARLLGWHGVHFRPARTRSGRWSTAIEGDRGAPDLLLARDGQVLLVELKSATGRLGPGQAEWLCALGSHGRLWRPQSWEQALAELKGR